VAENGSVRKIVITPLARGVLRWNTERVCAHTDIAARHPVRFGGSAPWVQPASFSSSRSCSVSMRCMMFGYVTAIN
jgi:hypothetical protein